jgi:type I restriction enzyme R subunit
VFRTELALLRIDPAFRGLKERIMEIASLLEALPNVPMVAAELALILEIQTDEFWQDIAMPMLETIRRRLRALVKLIEFKKRPIVYSDFEDRAGASNEMVVRGIPIGTNLDAFRRKARLFLRPYESHIAILKLRRNEPLTKSDLAEIETKHRLMSCGLMAASVVSSAHWLASITAQRSRRLPDSLTVRYSQLISSNFSILLLTT